MMDKVQKIREAVEKRYECWKEKESNSHSIESEIRMSECKHLLLMLNSLQEEPVSEDLGKVGSLKSLEYYPEKKTTNKTSKGVFDANMPRRKAYLRGFKDGAHAHKELIANKPVSEELEEAAKRYATEGDEISGLYIINEEVEAFKAGAKWQKENLWKPADGDDLPEYEREVVAFQETFPTDVDVPSLLKIVIAHRPNPEGYNGKSITTGQIEHYTPNTYDKGGWNIPDIKWWLDVELPKEIEL